MLELRKKVVMKKLVIPVQKVTGGLNGVWWFLVVLSRVLKQSAVTGVRAELKMH